MSDLFELTTITCVIAADELPNFQHSKFWPAKQRLST
jgi:hypothetical protein